MAVAFVALLHGPRLEALAGRRVARPAPLLRLKQEPLAVPCVTGALALLLLLEVLPYVQEMLRDWRAHPRRLEPSAARAA